MNLRRRPLQLAACCLAGALALVALADPQPNAQQPQPGGPPRSGEQRGGGMHPGFGPGGFSGRGFDPNSKEYQEFREQLKAFCVQHSPKRWQEFEDRVQRGGRSGFRGQMSAKFRELQALEKSDPALHAIKVRLIEVEDVEYGLITELKAAADDPKKAADLRAKLREQDEKYVRLRFEERSHKLDHLAKILDDERRKLADDRQGADRLINERLAELEKQGPDYFFVQRFPHRPGEGDGGSSTNPSTPTPTPATPPDK